MIPQLIGISLVAAIPLCLIALAGVVPARAGIFDIGLEGKMIVCAFVSVAVTVKTGSAMAGVLAAVVAGMLTGLLFWLLIDLLQADAVIVGVGFTALGLGGSRLASALWLGTEGTVQAGRGLPTPAGDSHGLLHDLFGGLSLLAWLTPAILVACYLLTQRSRFGLSLTALGDSPHAVESAGQDARRLRVGALLIGGALAGLAGAELALGDVQLFSPGMTAGRGFIGLSAVLLGGATVWGAAAACLFFSLAEG